MHYGSSFDIEYYHEAFIEYIPVTSAIQKGVVFLFIMTAIIIFECCFAVNKKLYLSSPQKASCVVQKRHDVPACTRMRD